ncbi:MAG: cation ABC transporter substrate-binding protein [Chloroflexi bacterium]|nr:cation ABC transporter substrate-binding protein [Chloroflexota bacterium]
MKNKLMLFIMFGLALILFTSCTAPDQADNEKMNITVSILPEKFFVERIGGEHVAVNVMVGPGDSPHTYEPKPEQMAALSQSKVYFAIGVEFEGAWMDKFISANPQMVIVDVSDNVEKIPMEDHHDEDDAEEDEHDGEELDPHIWTSPEIAKTIARRIAGELSSVDSQNAGYYHSNLEELLTEIEQLQSDIREDLRDLENRKFLVFHPAWDYFAREFGLEEIAIEVGGTEPSASELSAILETALKENIRVVFAQPEFSTQIAEYIASEINGEVVLITPLAENWLENLRTVTRTLKENL